MLFILANMKLHVWVYWQPSQCLFHTWVIPCSTTIPHLAKACWHVVSTITAVTICNGMGRLQLLYIPKMSLYFYYVPLWNNRPEVIVGQNQEFWRINVGKWHFEEVIVAYVGDFSRTKDLSYTCRKTTYMGKTDKRFQCTMNFSKCPGKCGCIIRSGGESIGLPSIAFVYMCLSIWNASKRLLLATGALYFTKISFSWYKGEYCIRII